MFQVVEAWMASESISNIKYLNLDTCDSLNEGSLTELVTRFGHQILGLNLGGHHKLLEYFWMNMIPKLRNVRFASGRISFIYRLKVLQHIFSTR